MKQSSKPKKYMIISLISNSLLSISKIITGVLIGSSAILSDGVHSLSDLITDIVAIYGLVKCNEKEDEEHPLGHGNFEYISSLILGMIILLFAYELAVNLINRESVVPNSIGLYIVIGTIIIKVFLSSFLIKKGKTLDNQILKTSGQESMNDVYSSIVVVVSLLVAQFDFSFNIYLDKIASIIIIFLIAKTGINSIKESVAFLLGKNADKKEIEKYKNILKENIKEIKKIDSFILLKQGPFLKAIIDVQIDGKNSVKQGHDIATKARDVLNKDKKINYVKVHIEPYKKKE